MYPLTGWRSSGYRMSVPVMQARRAIGSWRRSRLVDADGLDGLTMRRLEQALGHVRFDRRPTAPAATTRDTPPRRTNASAARQMADSHPSTLEHLPEPHGGATGRGGEQLPEVPTDITERSGRDYLPHRPP